MAEIIVKGLSKPFENACLELHEGGTGRVIEKYEVIELPPHGKLFDHNVVLKAVEEFQQKHNRAIRPEEFWRMLDREIPCFLEASNGCTD